MNKNRAMRKFRDFDFDIKSVEEDGTFAGYGSVFNVTDFYNEMVAPGAFAESLTDKKAKGRRVPILWQHRADTPLGAYADLHEDSHGLYVEGELLIRDVDKAREAHALMKAGAVSGLSIGYLVRESSFDEKTSIRTLTKVDLEEVSIVSFPANDEARVELVKRKLAHGELPTLPEFESILRDAGFSKSKATAIASRGLAPLLRGDPESSAEMRVLAEKLRSFSLSQL